MELSEAIRKRRSIRVFKAGKISKREILEILELGTYAPSAGNMQPWVFVLVENKAQRERLAHAALGQSFIADASFVIVVCANQARSAAQYGRRGYELYSIQDTAACVENILLAITNKGFGACWVGAFNETAVKKIINCPENIKPVAIIPVGIPGEVPEMPERDKLDDILHYETF